MYELRTASLNFSGVNTSPFEYHDGSEEKNHLNQTFRELLDQYKLEHPNIHWSIAKIDKIFNRERYSVLYRVDCGYVRGRLLNKEQFNAVWDRTFDLNQGIVGHMDLNDELVDQLRSFDWMAYRAFL